MRISAISISDRKGIRKKNIEEAQLVENFGIANDAHGGKWHRQLSFLAQESIDTMRQKGLDVVAGNFAENITTEGIDLTKITVGTHLSLGECEVIISQLGKVCHHKCAIYHQAGDCVMPREGIFAVVIKEGTIRVGDPITILPKKSSSAAIIGNKETEKQLAENLKNMIDQQHSPAFIRFDTLNAAEDNLDEILQDLIHLQKIDTIFLFDPTGKHQLAFVGFQQDSTEKSQFTKETSTIVYCRQLP